VEGRFSSRSNGEEYDRSAKEENERKEDSSWEVGSKSDEDCSNMSMLDEDWMDVRSGECRGGLDLGRKQSGRRFLILFVRNYSLSKAVVVVEHDLASFSKSSEIRNGRSCQQNYGIGRKSEECESVCVLSLTFV
jgi:hypothetical protein